MRVALGIEYDGSCYCGWQRQPHSVSIQSCVEAALSQVANHPVSVLCSGRTDTGVHAICQVVHFDTYADRGMRSWVFGANANLPGDIVVLWALKVPDDFHARFSALSRRYRYMIMSRSIRSPLYRQRLTWTYKHLHVQRMQQASKYLLGEHDFSSYRATQCQAHSPIRTIYHCNIASHENVITIDIRANGFLHRMVRNIAGVLMAVGTGKRSIDWPQQLLCLRDRKKGDQTAPADGLYFVAAEYPECFKIPMQDKEFGNT